MAREVDKSDLDSLSEEDLIYLRDRGQLTAEQEEEYLGGIVAEAPQAPPIEETPHVGDVGTATRPPETLRGNTEGEEEWNEDMTKAQLQAVARRRGLATSGSKDDLITRLEEADEEGGE